MPLKGTWIVDISPDRTEFLLFKGADSNSYLDKSGAVVSRYELGQRRCSAVRRAAWGILSRPTEAGWAVATDIPYRGAWAGTELHQSAAAWSPDGQQLVYAREGELHLARSDGTEVRKLATVTGRPFFVRWSPDGRKLRLSVRDAGGASLWELSVDDGRVRPLLPDWDPSLYTCCGNWTRDGKYFVFQSNGNLWAWREKTSFLQRVSREPTQLTAGPLAAYWPLPSLDGKRLFIAFSESRAEFLRYDLKSNQFVPAFAGMSGDELEISKDGKWVAYVSVPDGSLLRSAADGTERVQLAPPSLGAGLPHWSPDGKQIAFMAAPAGTPSRIYVVEPAGGTPRQVTNGESGAGR